ncbi:MAG: thioredoxin fold domain-containing protein [Gammaproteobacteria bacterium]|nr:thioredoxin fold domain-containing protein [Gammaproteobacteria bacterium]
MLVYFGQEDCAYCQALMEVNFALPDVVDYTRRHFDVIAVDIWGAREVVDMTGAVMTEREYAVANDTNFTPSFILYDDSAREVFRIRGYYPPYRFRAALEYAADGHYATETFRQYLERADPPPKFELEDLNEQPFFDSPPYALDRSRYPADSPLAVFFEQRDCHACDVLHSAPLADEHVRTLLISMQVVQLDMWSDTPVLTPDGRRFTAREWAGALDITWAPTLVFFDAHGLEIIRVDSVVQQYRLGRVLEYVVEGGYASGLNYQQWHRRKAVEPAQP